MAIAEDLAIIHEPDVDDAFHVEQHGIDFIPESERWATPRDIFGMWAGRERPDRVLHLRRHPHDVRADVRPGRHHHRPGQPVLFPARAVLTAGAEHRDNRLRQQPGAIRAERLAPDLILQLDHADRLRGRGPDPDRRRRPGAHGQVRDFAGRPGQGRPGHRRRADSGDPPVPRPRRHREDAALAGHSLRDPLRRHAGVRHPSRQSRTSSRQAATGRGSWRRWPSPSL